MVLTNSLLTVYYVLVEVASVEMLIKCVSVDNPPLLFKWLSTEAVD